MDFGADASVGANWATKARAAINSLLVGLADPRSVLANRCCARAADGWRVVVTTKVLGDAGAKAELFAGAALARGDAGVVAAARLVGAALVHRAHARSVVALELLRAAVARGWALSIGAGALAWAASMIANALPVVAHLLAWAAQRLIDACSVGTAFAASFGEVNPAAAWLVLVLALCLRVLGEAESRGDRAECGAGQPAQDLAAVALLCCK